MLPRSRRRPTWGIRWRFQAWQLDFTDDTAGLNKSASSIIRGTLNPEFWQTRPGWLEHPTHGLEIRVWSDLPRVQFWRFLPLKSSFTRGKRAYSRRMRLRTITQRRKNAQSICQVRVKCPRARTRDSCDERPIRWWKTISRPVSATKSKLAQIRNANQ